MFRQNKINKDNYVHISELFEIKGQIQKTESSKKIMERKRRKGNKTILDGQTIKVSYIATNMFTIHINI